MTHLTEYASVRAGDAFDSFHGAVRVERDVASRVAVEVDVLRCDLTVRTELFNDFLRCYEATFTVRYGDGVRAAEFDAAEPRGKLGYDFGLYHARYVTTDIVVGKCRHLGFEIDDLAVRYESELDECLEAVADASMSPSLCWRSSVMASLMRGLRSIAAMNLPEPSGSSPALKPPGSMRICALLMAMQGERLFLG